MMPDAYIASGVSLFIFILGGAVVWGKMKQRLSGHGKEIRSLKNGLYKPDGTLIYVTEKGCTTRHNDCQIAMCRKIDEVKEIIHELSDKIDNDRRSRDKEIKEIVRFMGRVDEFMRGSGGNNGGGYG